MKTQPFLFKSSFVLFALGMSGVSLLKAEPPAPTSPPVVTIPARGAVGGGWSDAGPMGEYYVGDKLEGTPAFTRREVRIDFDWGTVFPIGGSLAEPYRSFPHDNFSARWTGKLIPRFTEPYVFTVSSESAPTLFVKDSVTGKLSKISLSKNSGKTLLSKPVELKKGEPIEVVLEYHHAKGAANCSIAWSSPSTPNEVIEPVIEQGLNIASFQMHLWADRQRDIRWDAEKGVEYYDENAQIKASKSYFLFAESSRPTPGYYLMSFTGYANVRLSGFPNSRFIIDGKEYEQLPAKGPGYDPKTNKTQALFKFAEELPTNRFIYFSDAFRDPEGTQPGILNFHMMRPLEKGSETPCPADAVVNPPMKRLVSNFTCMRYLDVANIKTTPFWKDRTPATYEKFNKRNGGENWEYLVMLANETGRDLYLTTPVAADDEYFHKLALLMRYGSDGVEPYTQPTANPKFPPFNSNLHLYYEVGNEIWNWTFGSSGLNTDMGKKAIADNTEDGIIDNYDGHGNYRRYHAIRTVKSSNAFREVFGDAAMNNRIRPLVEFQYANGQETASNSFLFLDNYYNNGNGEHVKEPHPISYYIWGGGGAAYYGVGNGEGTQNEVVLKDSSFEETVVADGESVTPTTGPWSFSGNAGVYRTYDSAVDSYTSAEKRINLPAKTGVGMRFTTGPKPLWVYKLGRVYNDQNGKGARISLLKASDLSLVAKVETGPIRAFLAAILGYYWGEFADKKPVQLEPNTEYLLVAQDLDESSRIEGFDLPIKPGNGLSKVKSIKVKMADPVNPQSWEVNDGEPNACGGPVTMLYTEKANLVMDWIHPNDGSQAAYITGIGEFSQQVNFAKAGSYAITINAVQSNHVQGQRESAFQFYCDAQNASPLKQNDVRGNADAFSTGGFVRNNGFKEDWGSAVFTIDKPGLHTLRFVGVTKNEVKPSSVLIDNIRIVSADAIMESGFGGGSACGQPVEHAWGASQAKDSRFGISFGLPRVSYETGWSLGGDFTQKPIQNWCKLMDPRAQKINAEATDIWKKTGGYLPVWGVYTFWVEDDTENADKYPITKSFIQSSQQLSAEADNGIPIPAVLTDKNAVFWGGYTDLKAPGKILSWTVVTPETAVYKVTVDVAFGGKYTVDIDGQTLGPAVEGGTEYLVKTTKGIHGILIRCKEAPVTLQKISVTAAGN